MCGGSFRKLDPAWVQQQRRLHLFCTPIDASWLNRIEIFVGILMRKSLAAASLDAVANVAA